MCSILISSCHHNNEQIKSSRGDGDERLSDYLFHPTGSSPRTQVNGRGPLLTARDLGLREATIVAAREGYD